MDLDLDLDPVQRQRLFRATLYGLLVVFVVVLALVADWPRIADTFLRLDIAVELLDGIFRAARNTLVYTSVAFVGATLVGLVLALMRLSPVTPYRFLASFYIEVFRGLPALLTIFLFGFGIPIAFDGFRVPGGNAGAGVLALVVVGAAYTAETIRAGIQAVPKGQTEAARSLGMSQGRTTVSIVIPQAFRIIIPPLTNEFVLLMKDTSLLFIIGTTQEAKELTTFGRDALFSFGNSTPLLVVGLAYLVITVPLTQLVRYMEARRAVR